MVWNLIHSGKGQCSPTLTLLECTKEKLQSIAHNAEGKLSTTADSTILMSSRSEDVRIMLPNVDLRAKDSYGLTALHYLSNNRNEGIIEVIDESIERMSEVFRQSIDWNAKDNDGMTPLHNAMAAANAKFVKYLLNNNADANAETDEGITPCLAAFHSSDLPTKQRIECIKLIMKHGGYPVVEMKKYLQFFNNKSLINHDFLLLQPILAHLVIREAKGERISEKLLKSIFCHQKLKKYYFSCRKELDQMKKEKFSGCEDRALTLFDFLTDHPNRFIFYNSHCLLIDKKMEKYESIYTYYTEILWQRRCEFDNILFEDNRDFFMGSGFILTMICIIIALVRLIITTHDLGWNVQKYVAVLVNTFTSIGFFIFLAVFGMLVVRYLLNCKL